MVSDIKESKFSTTDYNPSKDEIDTLGGDIDIVISCRGKKELKNLYPTHVSNIEEILKGWSSVKLVDHFLSDLFFVTQS